jgi:uncharacterized protein YutE (UPF0331/DUF86 family)
MRRWTRSVRFATMLAAILNEKDVIPADLAMRLGDAAKQRNLIVHLYMEIDDRAVFASLNDLRRFAAAVEGLGRLAEPDDSAAASGTS